MLAQNELQQTSNVFVGEWVDLDGSALLWRNRLLDGH